MKLLVALDGSDASMRAVEHVGQVVDGRRPVEITLYYACATIPKLLEQGGSEDPDEERRLEDLLHEQLAKWVAGCSEKVEREIFARAKSILRDTGVPMDTVVIRTKIDAEPHPDVAMSIIREAEEGNHDVVVLGRRGMSMLKEFVLGSVSSKVIHHTKDRAVWLVE